MEPKKNRKLKHKIHADDAAYAQTVDDRKRPTQVYFSDEQEAGPSYAHTFSPLSSVEVTKPLLSSKWRSRHSSTLMSQLKKSVQFERTKSMEIDVAELACEDSFMDYENFDHHVEKLSNLLHEIRSLPCSMKEKRQRRQEILDCLPAEKHHHLHFTNFNETVRKDMRDYIQPLLDKCKVWSSSLKLIEGSYGVGVASYFHFLRLLLVLNLIIFFIMFVFLIIPQVVGVPEPYRENVSLPSDMDFVDKWHHLPAAALRLPSAKSDQQRRNDKHLTELGSLLNTFVEEGFLDASLRHSDRNQSKYTRVLRAEKCHQMYRELMNNMTKPNFKSRLLGLLEGIDWMENTILFIGHYVPDVRISSGIYNIDVAFVVVVLVLIVITIVIMMGYLSRSVQESVLDNLEATYCCILFCGWDFCITEAKSATRQQGSLYQELVSTSHENRRTLKRKEWTNEYKFKIYSIRAAVHIVTLLIVIVAYYVIFFVTSVQVNAQRRGLAKGFMKSLYLFLPPFTITGLNFLFPLILYFLVRFEEYRTAKMINITLLRIVLLREASIVILVSSFYDQITCEPKDFCYKGYENCPSPICWETYVGQQMYRLTLMDLFVQIGVILFWETPRNFVVKRYPNKLTKLVGRSYFDIPIEVLGLVYSQTLSWLGMFYSPLLPAIMVMKIIIFFYLKKFNVLKNCVPSPTAYKASRSNTIFVLVLLLSFFITVGVLGYSIIEIETSPSCSPFRYFVHMVHALGVVIAERSTFMRSAIAYTFTPLIAYPILILLCLNIYYFITRISAHKKMLKLLKVQLTMEGKDKQFLLDRITKIRPKTN